VHADAAGAEEVDAEVDDDRTPEEVCSVLVARASTRAELDAVDRCAASVARVRGKGY
jgi:hypothetical protein